MHKNDQGTLTNLAHEARMSRYLIFWEDRKMSENNTDVYSGRNVRSIADRSETYDMDKKLIINLRNLGHVIRFLYEGKGSQKRILIILYEAGSMTQRELTEKIGIQPGSASEVIGKLESAGLITRAPSQTDRRTVDIQLTETGKQQAKEAARQRRIRHQEMFSCLSEEEKTTLLALSEKLNADWDSRYLENKKRHGHPDIHRKERGEHAEHQSRSRC